MIKVEGDIVFDLFHSFNEIWYKQKIVFQENNKQEKSNPAQEKNKTRILISAGAENNDIIRAIKAREMFLKW